MNFGSICSGIEAASVAFGPLGWKAQWFSEIEPFPCAVLKHHYPDIPNLGDIRKIYDKEQFRTRAVDLVCGGTPCQAFSIAGLRGGLSDERGSLSLEFCRIVHAKKPRWVLWENVPGVLSSKDNAFGCFLAGLVGADTPLLPGTRNGKWTGAGIVSAAKFNGYGVAWRILDAQYFGVPQRRRRVFVVGYFGDWRYAVEVLFERKSVYGNPAPRCAQNERIADCFETGFGGGRSTEIAPSSDRDMNIVYENHGQDSRVKEVEVSPQINAKSGRNTPKILQQGCDVYNLSITGEKACCLNAESGASTHSGPKVLAGTVRRLTPRECERLQGFPDGYTDIPYRGRKVCPDSPRYKALGNSWAVPCARWIGKRIQAVDDFMRRGNEQGK